MRRHYDFSQSRPNPYAAKMKKPVTLRLGLDVIDYFKSVADDTGILCQSLINRYLRDCAQHRRRPQTRWASCGMPLLSRETKGNANG